MNTILLMTAPERSLSLSKEPSVVVPKVENRGSNDSLVVTWDHPVGGLDTYILNISSTELNRSIQLNNMQQNYTFNQLKAATFYEITLTSVIKNLQETSSVVCNATCK